MYAPKLVLNDDTEEDNDKGTCALNIFQLHTVRGTKEWEKLLICTYGQTKKLCDCDLV